MTPAAPTATDFPPGRYGKRRDPARRRHRRWVTFVLAGLVGLAGLAIAVKLFEQYAQPVYEVTIIDITDLSDHGVTVVFDVRLPPGEGATCTVQGHTRDGELIGQASVAVPPAAPGQTVSRVTYTLATTARPMTGEVPGCGP